MFEAVQFVELAGQIDPEEKVLGSSDSELRAVDIVRDARHAFLNSGRAEYAWWVVRKQGDRLAQFIADSKSDKEFVLDLTSGQLVEI